MAAPLLSRRSVRPRLLGRQPAFFSIGRATACAMAISPPRSAMLEQLCLPAPRSQKATAHFILGKVLLSHGQLNSAEAELKEALALDPTNEAAAAVLARLQRRKP